MKVKNIATGPRGINTLQGPVILEKGEERELDVIEAEANVAKATGWFELSGSAAADPRTGEPAKSDAKVDADAKGGRKA